jgi:hypothetical protein
MGIEIEMQIHNSFLGQTGRQTVTYCKTDVLSLQPVLQNLCAVTTVHYCSIMTVLPVNAPSTADPIDDWLNSPPITSVTDGLQWWTTMAASGHPLSEMGLNFLSIPGTY